MLIIYVILSSRKWFLLWIFYKHRSHRSFKILLCLKKVFWELKKNFFLLLLLAILEHFLFLYYNGRFISLEYLNVYLISVALLILPYMYWCSRRYSNSRNVIMVLSKGISPFWIFISRENLYYLSNFREICCIER